MIHGAEKQKLQAILTLMEDRDPEVQRSIRGYLYQQGEKILPYLRELSLSATPQQREWITNFIREYQVEALKRMQRILRLSMGSSSIETLENFYLALSCFGYPESNIEAMRLYFDRVALQHPRSGSALAQYQALNELLFHKEKFRGAWEEEYYHPDSIYAHTVMQYRRGTPLSLSILYLLIARRIGLQTQGINMPLHFILYAPELDLFLDPFQGGTFISYEECQQFIEYNHISFTPTMLKPTSIVSIALRALRNLVYGYNRLNQLWESSILQQCIHTVLEAIGESGKS